MEKNKDNLSNLRSRGLAFAYRVGDYVEERIGQMVIENGREAPVLSEGAMVYPRVWYRVPLSDGISGDGSEYHIYLKAAHKDKLVVFFSGGGVAWNAFTAARPVTGGKVAAGLPNFYWNNLRPFTQIMNINIGITENGNPANPFEDWSFVIVTYATGDFHVGDNDYTYTDSETGESGVVRFHGYQNFCAAMRKAKEIFPDPKKLLIAGDSAGAFAVPALAADVTDIWYPDCSDVTCFSDSGQLLYDNWQETAREMWKTREDIWQAIRTPNITLDWYHKLYAKKKDDVRYLYACSTHDYLLSAYYNDVVNKEFTSDAEIQEAFYVQFVQMLRELKEITPGFTFFVNEFPNLMVMKRGMKGGTAHTCVREKIFYLPVKSGVSMCKWLGDAVNGELYDVGVPEEVTEKTP
ncbi:MAG: pectinacetylesterase family protein [Lachnospiraceae bacterium]|nr:pectinacetylesterase family protein [Lachnospiraceae bacterium]